MGKQIIIVENEEKEKMNSLYLDEPEKYQQILTKKTTSKKCSKNI
jgi:hypothetical protein